MSGHNKWAQIKHKKAVVDAKRGKIFGKLSRAISIAASGNPDPSTNLRLKGEIDRARAVNMPSDNIERAIRKTTEKDSLDLTEMVIEIVGPGNVGLLAIAITDNGNRTMNEIRQLAQRHSAHLAGQGSIAWMFSKSGVIRLPDSGDVDELQLTAIDAGALDVQEIDDQLVIQTKPEDLERIKKLLGQPRAESSLEYVPTTIVPVEPKDQAALESLIDALDEHDDIQDVFSNADY